ncbi:MAG TPA: sigma-70 family RNA polymerase sigma factor, partial [Opitutaceae bacterium]|nr:sigma-70 family RNA polymerase sigma factor [Opitutaceae bacterium]
MTSDTELLRRYVTDHSEAAFAELVRQRLGLVYGVALRRTRNPHLAEEACQKVFTALARKAPALAGRPVLAGWLYRGAQLAAAELMRNEARRARRERAVAAVADRPEDAMSPDWDKARLLLDEAVAGLPEGERDAVLLRFVDGEGYAAVGARLGASENAARMRVNRALERLRAALGRRGVDSSLAALALALAAEASAAAPAGLAAQIGAGACAAAGLGTGLVTLMSSTKMATILGLAALAAGGAALHEARSAKASSAALADMTLERDHLRASLEAAVRHSPRAKGPAAAKPAAEEGGQLQAGIVPAARARAAAAADPQRLAYFHRRYDGFARERGLTPEEADKFLSILMNWDEMRRDLQAQIRQQGAVATPEAEKMRDQLQQEYEVDPLIDLLGRDGMQAYMRYERSSFYQLAASPVVEELSAANLGLTDDQQARLIASLQANLRQVKGGPDSLGTEIIYDWKAVAAGGDAYLNPQQ